MQDKIFTIDNIEDVKKKIMSSLLYLAQYIQHSTLGGNDRVSLIITISLDNADDWDYGILENSLYIKLYISNTGYIELISQSHKLKRFRAGQIKDIDSLIKKIKKQVIIKEA